MRRSLLLGALACAALSAACGKKDKSASSADASSAIASSTASAPTHANPYGTGSAPYSNSIHPPPPLSAAKMFPTIFPRVIGVDGDLGDPSITVGQPLAAADPLRLAKAGGTLTLRDSKSGLEFRLTTPLRVYLAPARVGLVEGTFESLVIPPGALEFWIATPYGTVRTTGRIRLVLNEKSQTYERLDGEAYLFRPSDKANPSRPGGGKWEKIETPIVDHATWLVEEKLVKLCSELDSEATKLASEVANAKKIDPVLSEKQMNAKKLAQAGCETARLRLRESMKKHGAMLYSQIESKSVL